MEKIILLLGSVLFGEVQGTDGEIRVLQVDEVKAFNNEEELNNFIDELEEEGDFDSYLVMNDENIVFDEGEKEKYEELLKNVL